jgi:hypothetical protein
MARENDERILRSRLVVLQALWNHEREQILQTLGVEEINPHAWTTEALVEEIQDCIEGRKMLASVAAPKQKPAEKPADQAEALSDELSREETEDWLNDMPLFEED